jgi:hypothetical protein
MLGADHRRVTARMRAAPSRWRSRAPGFARMLAAALLGLSLATPGGAGALAAEWIVGGSVSQRLQFESNRDLDEDGGPIYGATTALGLDFTALAPRTQWQFETGASVGFFGGEGDTDDLTGVFPNFAAAVDHNGKYIDTGASFGIDLQPAAFAQIDETGITEGDATQLSVRLAGDAAMALDPRNRLSFGVSGRIIRFTSGSTSLNPTETYGTSLSWGHSLSADTQTSLSFGVQHFSSEAEDDPRSLSFDLAAGVGHTINPRLSVDASLGPSVTRTTRTVLGLRESDFSVGAVGDLALAWRPQPDTRLVFALSHGLEPSELGELRTTTALGAGLQHSVNSWISSGVNLLVQRQSSASGFDDDPGAGSDTDFGTERILATLSPNLAFSLTPEVALQVSYSLRMEHEREADVAFSNGVFLTLTRAFDIIP